MQTEPLSPHYDGLSPREVLEAALRPSERDFQGNKGKPLRELVAGAKLALALGAEESKDALVRNLRLDPPDIALMIQGVESFWEVVEVTGQQQRPRQEALAVEAFTQSVAGEADPVKKVALVEASLAGKVQERSVRCFQREIETVIQQTRFQLLKKAAHYQAKAGPQGALDFGLLLHSHLASAYRQTEPAYWTDWLSKEEQLLAECFPSICLVDRDTIDVSTVVFRLDHQWLTPPQRYRYVEPEGLRHMKEWYASIDNLFQA